MWASALQLMYPFACETLATEQEIPRVGNKGYSGSPAADTFACRDGWLAIGANTPTHIERLMQVLGVAPAEVAPLLEQANEDGPAFARARDPQAFRDLLAARLAGESATDLERRLNESGVPAARVRTLREFTQEAVDTGLLEPVMLGEGEASAPSRRDWAGARWTDARRRSTARATPVSAPSTQRRPRPAGRAPARRRGKRRRRWPSRDAPATSM